MHVSFVKRRYEIQAVICEAENDVIWPLRAGCEKIVISREDNMILHYKQKSLRHWCARKHKRDGMETRGCNEAATPSFDAEKLVER